MGESVGYRALAAGGLESEGREEEEEQGKNGGQTGYQRRLKFREPITWLVFYLNPLSPSVHSDSLR